MWLGLFFLFFRSVWLRSFDSFSTTSKNLCVGGWVVMVVLVLVAVVLGEVMKAGGDCRPGGYGILLANVCV